MLNSNLKDEAKKREAGDCYIEELFTNLKELMDLKFIKFGNPEINNKLDAQETINKDSDKDLLETFGRKCENSKDISPFKKAREAQKKEDLDSKESTITLYKNYLQTKAIKTKTQSERMEASVTKSSPKHKRKVPKNQNLNVIFHINIDTS